jgi:hypothetical protein
MPTLLAEFLALETTIESHERDKAFLVEVQRAVPKFIDDHRENTEIGQTEKKNPGVPNCLNQRNYGFHLFP